MKIGIDVNGYPVAYGVAPTTTVQFPGNAPADIRSGLYRVTGAVGARVLKRGTKFIAAETQAEATGPTDFPFPILSLQVYTSGASVVNLGKGLILQGKRDALGFVYCKDIITVGLSKYGAGEEIADTVLSWDNPEIGGAVKMAGSVMVNNTAGTQIGYAFRNAPLDITGAEAQLGWEGTVLTAGADLSLTAGPPKALKTAAGGQFDAIIQLLGYWDTP